MAESSLRIPLTFSVLGSRSLRAHPDRESRTLPGLFQDFHESPSLEFAERPGLTHANKISHLALVLCVMDMKLLSPTDIFAVDGMLHQPLYLDYHGFDSAAAHDAANPDFSFSDASIVDLSSRILVDCI